MDWVYLDNNATTMIDPRVLEAMRPFLAEQYANPSSTHHFGQQARYAVEAARECIAGLLGLSGGQVIFTSGGTEANDLGVRGMLASRPSKRHLVTTAVEHASILRLAQQIEKEGYRVTYVGVDRLGRLDPAEFEAALGGDTALASVMHANNETGVVFPVERLGEIAASKGIPLHVDAIQTTGKVVTDLGKWPVSLVTLAAHKFHGPKGVGVLCIGRGVRPRPRLVGGHQEGDLRAGTENVPAIVGMAEALRLAVEHLEEENGRVRALRDRLETGILQRIPLTHGLGHREDRLPNTTAIGFEALEAEAVLMLLSNHRICASSGSACGSGSLSPSHVLTAMGLDERVVHGAVRFSLSRFNTDQEIDRVLEVVPSIIERLRRVMGGA
ncbi:MAG TPA: aminotransferase class V-fold PLP-dependent enzyme [Phycisphaerae bacterium]|nr:aminotransferase class V-fold PLP-dependent enzyme [Phycisphaerae bacterium]HRY66740.1 aminotransferase class V-fold PLP-dependent enzyme [Phycisphaerae bacterium]HSA29010.1 aminotransferase class V-fold PLP-dependent enzyme [Phycisphaerae bacterium]